MKELSRHYDFMCPHCGMTIEYNRKYYDKHIARLGMEINDIQAKIRVCGNDTERKKRLIHAKTMRESQRAELKFYRSQANIAVNQAIDMEFRRLVKDRLGEDEYKKLREEAEFNLEHEDIQETMRKPYTRKGGKCITSVGKL